MDFYEAALRRLKEDPRSLLELERQTGVPYETIRDIKYERNKRFYFQTVKKIAAYYYPKQVQA